MFAKSIIEARQTERAWLADAMAQYERSNPVETLPIRLGEAPKQAFTIHVPGKPKAERVIKAEPINTARKNKRIAIVRDCLEKGMTLEATAKVAECSEQHVSRLIHDHKLRQPGQKTLRENTKVRNERIQQIALMLKAEPKLSIVEIGRRLSINPKTASKLIAQNGLRK